MVSERPEYLSYLLRLWSVNGAEKTVWRASLENALTGERKAFASLDDLFDFLRQQTGVRSDLEAGLWRKTRFLMYRQGFAPQQPLFGGSTPIDRLRKRVFGAFSPTKLNSPESS
jgi:hypothetical protein